MDLTPDQIARIEAWRDNFNPDAIKWLEDGVKAFRNDVAKGADNRGQLAGMEAVLEMARELAVRP